MEFFKLLTAPKTKDPEYEDARLLFKTMYLDPDRYSSGARSLVRSIEDLTSACLKLATDFNDWCSEAPNDAGEIAEEAHVTLTRATQLDNLTESFLFPRIQPNFVDALVTYKDRVEEVHKMKEERNRTVKEFDKARERVRILENDKKPKQDKIDKAQAQSEEAQRIYEQSNRQFIDNVNNLGRERIVTLGGPFKSLTAILCQYLQQIGAGEVTIVKPLPKPSVPHEVQHQEETPAPAVPEQNEPKGLFGELVGYSYNEPSHPVHDPGYQGDDLQDDGWDNPFNPVEQGYVQQNSVSYTYTDDGFGKNPFD